MNSLDVQQPHEAGTIISPILQMRKLSHREVNCPAQGHTDGKGWSLDLNSGSLDPDSLQYSQGILGISNSVANSAEPISSCTEFLIPPQSGPA